MPGALALLEEANRSPVEFLSRHMRGDWGDLCNEDKAENELSLEHDFRLLSNYAVTQTRKLWVITEADRSVTTLLLPEEVLNCCFLTRFRPSASDHCELKRSLRNPGRASKSLIVKAHHLWLQIRNACAQNIIV